MIPSTDQDVDDVTLGEMLTAAHRGQVDYCVPGGMSVSQSSSSVMFDGSGQPDGERMVDHLRKSGFTFNVISAHSNFSEDIQIMASLRYSAAEESEETLNSFTSLTNPTDDAQQNAQEHRHQCCERSSDWSKLHFGMEVKFVLIKLVRMPRDSRKHIGSHFDQKGPDHCPALIAHKITADFTFSTLRIIVIRSGIVSNELWIVSRTVQRMQAIRACVAATVRRDLKEPVAPVERSHKERVTFRWRRFLLLIPRSYSFYSPVMSDDSGRNS